MSETAVASDQSPGGAGVAVETVPPDAPVEPPAAPAAPVEPAEPVEPIAPPVPPAAAVVVAPGSLATYFAAFEHAAGGVYHRLLALEGDVSTWVGSNAALSPLVDEAVAFGTSLLAAHGIPVPSLVLAAQTVLAGLGKLAAADPTVKSGAGQVAT